MNLHNNYSLILGDDPSSGEEILLSSSETIIGRDASADIVIDSPVVSREHARISQKEERHFIEDLGSSNGTFLNGEPVTGTTPLTPGDVIRLGKTITIYFQGPQQPHTAETKASEGTDPRQTGPDLAERSPPVREEPRPPGLAGTVMADEADFSLLEDAGPPSFMVAIAGGEPQTYTLTADVLTIGRAEDNDVVIPSPIVSRYHARLERANGGYQLVPLPEAGNPVLFEGRPLPGAQMLRHEDKLRIGSLDPGVMVTMTYDSPAEAALIDESLAIDFGQSNVITIGRHPENDVVLSDPTVSSFHAQVERVGQRYRVRDLRSSNGTFVNDQRIEGEVWLNTADDVRVGSHRFVLGDDQLAQYDESSGLQVSAIDLNKWVRDDLNILQNISAVFQPREFIVVVGQSGGGKSTLVDAIAGYRPATHGRVFVNDIDVYSNFDAIRNDIGFVPQKDIIHMELTVYQALDYAAQLRMPPDTTDEERHQRIMEVLEDLDLAHRKDVQISGLSGGQQKRVSIGVELLTQPGLFFLDEPTSGLDPGTETALMHLMRRLADQGRTIVLITHATKNVMLADKVIFLARGGYLTWFGPPDEALKYFDQYRSDRDRRARDMEFDEIYAVLDDPSTGSPPDWADRYLSHPAYQQYVAEPLEKVSQNGARVAASAEVQPTTSDAGSQKVSFVRQFLILSKRNVTILTRDKFSLALMLAAAPLIGLLDVVLAILLGRNPYDFNTGDVFSGLITLFMLPLYGLMVGGLAMMREIVKEAEIYRRERLVNLKIFPYVLSKVWVAALLALYQALIYTVIRYLAFKMPGGFLEFVLIFVTMVMATLAGMMVGLFASALAPNANSAPLLVILFILPQIVLGGALIPLPTYINIPVSTRWGFQGLVGITGVGSDVVADACWALPSETRDALSLEEAADLGCNCLGASMLHQESCNFPGLGLFYNPAVDAPPPTEPPPLREEPPRPIIPEQPQEPEDQSDSVAMAEYFDALEAWQAEVTEIQTAYEADIDLYRADAEVYQAEIVEYQTALAEWQGARFAAVQPAQALVGSAYTDYGWTFVNKDNVPAFVGQIALTWVAQLTIGGVLFVGILVLQKRKDVT